MKIDWKKRSTVRMVSNLIIVAAGILVYFILNNFSTITGYFKWFLGIVAPFLYGFVFAYLLNTPVSLFERLFIKLNGKKRKPPYRLIRIASIFLTILLALIAIAALFYIIIPQLVDSISGLLKNTSYYIESLENAFFSLLEKYNINSEFIQSIVSKYDDILTYVSSALEQALPEILSFSKQLTTSIYNIFIGIIISVYVLYSKETFFAQIKKVLFALFKKKHLQRYIQVFHESNRAFLGFINGKLLDSLIIGILCYIGMLILGMPYALLISAIVAVTNIIPYIGPFIGAIPSALIIFIASPSKALWFIIFIFLLQQFDGNILGPRILGNSIGLSSFWVLFAIILGGGIAGFWGMFLGAPAFSVIYSLTRVFIESRLAKKGLSPDTKDYYLGSSLEKKRESPKIISLFKKWINKIILKFKKKEKASDNATLKDTKESQQ